MRRMTSRTQARVSRNAPVLPASALADRFFDVSTVIDESDAMSTTQKRATVYLDQEIHRALRVKAAETDRTISDLVNEAIQLALTEDADDLASFDERATEPNLPFEDVVKELRQRGKI